MANVANEFVMFARDLASRNNFLNALNMYLCAFAIEPRWKKGLGSEFLSVLSKMNEELAALENIAAIFANLEKAIEIFPSNVDLLNETGSYLYRHGLMAEALEHFEKAFSVDSSNVSVEKNLNNAKAFLFPKEQFRILNDKKRNTAYRKAIKGCVTAGDNVIDIDVGTGLLALYANECNPEWIDGCETSSAMAQLAESVRRENHAHNIVIGNKISMTLKYTNACGRRCVLLTDAIDSGLFGENILQSVYHAWENILNENSKIIPGKAEYFVAGIKCDELYKKFNLCQNVKNILNVTHMNVHPSTLCGESYCSEDVHLYENLKYMSEPTSLFKIDFNSIEDIYEKLHRQLPYNAELTAMEDGEINMVIGWFNLHLTDDIMLTSDPRSDDRASAYQQAVFFDFLPKKVRRNETISVSFLTNGGRLAMFQYMNTAITRISLETIAFLNDTEFINMITKSIGAVSVHLGQIAAMDEIDIVDLSPFPLFGILMMRRGANSLICLAKTLDDEAFLQTVLVANGIPKSKVIILVTEYWSLDVFKDKKFHVVFSQIVDLNGDINVRRHWIVDHLKQCHLVPGGLCLPSSVTVMGQLVSSSYLDTNNRLRDENVGYRMEKHVNRYKVSQIMHLDIARLEYEALSDEFEVATSEALTSDVVTVSVLKDGDCNAILCWYKVQLMEHWNEIYTNRSNSCVQSMAYMTASDRTKVFRGDEAHVLRCVEPTDRSYKLLLEIEPH